MNLFHSSAVAAFLSSDFCLRLTQSLLHFLWQGLAIGLLLWIAERVLRRASSQVRYAVGAAALLMMVACLPATYVALGYLAAETPAAMVGPVAAPAADARASATSNGSAIARHNVNIAGVFSGEVGDNVAPSGEPNQSRPWSWQSLQGFTAQLAPCATLAYLLGVAIMLARLSVALAGGHRLRSSATPVNDGAILAMAARQAQRVGLKVVPAIAWCQRTAVPLVVGIARPMILLPTSIASGLSPDQLEALLAHELAHLKRLDLLVNLVQRLAESLLFFHPAVWYVSRQISIERENCCDDCVLAAGWGRVDYADALVRMAEVCAAVRGLTGLEGAALLAASGEGASQFKRRVLRLLDSQDHLRVGISRGWLLAAFGAVLLGLAAIPFAANWKDRAVAGQAERPPSPAEAQIAGTSVVTPAYISFRGTPWPEVLKWYAAVVNQPIEMQVVPSGNFTYDSPRPMNHREIILLITREAARQGYCLTERNGKLAVETADVLAREYAESLRKDFMFGHELRKGPDKFDAYFELVDCRVVGETKPPAPEGPAIAYVLKARRDFTAAELTKFLSDCFGIVSFPSLKTGQPILADGYATLHNGKWLGTSAPALAASEQIEVWQNRFQEWNARPPADYRVVIEGQVVGADGKPLPSASIRELLLEDGSEFPGGEELGTFLNWAFGGEAIVDREGKFHVSLQQASQYVRKVYLFAVAPGYAPQRIGPIAVGFEKPAVPVKIELKQGFTGRLRLVLPDGRALEMGEVEVAAQDDLYARGIPLAKLPITKELIVVENCPAGPLLLRVRMRGYDEQEVRDVRLYADQVTEVKVPLAMAGQSNESGSLQEIWDAKVYQHSRELSAMKGWVIAWDVQHATQHGDGARVSRLRVFPDGRIAAWPGIGSPLVETHIGREEVASLVNWFIDEQHAGLRKPAVNAVVDGKKVPIAMDPLPRALWDQEGSRVAIVRDGKTYDLLSIAPPRPDRPEPKLPPATAGHLSEEATERLTRLSDLTVAGGREALAAHAAFAQEQLQRRHSATTLKITHESLRHAGFDSDGTLALFFHFGADGPGVGFPRGEMVVRVPKDGLRFVDRAEYWTAEGKGDRWGRATEEEDAKSQVSAAKQALEKVRSSLESSQRLASKGLISQLQLDAAEVAVRQAEAELAAAQARHERLQSDRQAAAIKRVNSLLDKKVSLSVARQPLVFVLDTLEKAHGVAVTVDLKEVRARGATINAQVSIDVADKPLREVFKAVLTTAGLNFDVAEKGIFIPAKARPPAVKPAQTWADLTVQFVYDGPKPEVKKLPTTNDVAAFGREVVDESLLVGDKGALANVAVYVTSAGVPVHPEAKRKVEHPAELKVTGAGTRPRILPTLVSQKLRLVNDTDVGVNFHWWGQFNSPFNVVVARKNMWETTLDKAERAPSRLTDNIHPWLIAYLLPLDHPYAAVSGADGSARLTNLPEGEWTFRFWHEKAGYLKSADGQREFKIKVAAGENRLRLRVSPEFVVQAGDDVNGIDAPR